MQFEACVLVLLILLIPSMGTRSQQLASVCVCGWWGAWQVCMVICFWLRTHTCTLCYRMLWGKVWLILEPVCCTDIWAALLQLCHCYSVCWGPFTLWGSICAHQSTLYRSTSSLYHTHTHTRIRWMCSPLASDTNVWACVGRIMLNWFLLVAIWKLKGQTESSRVNGNISHLRLENCSTEATLRAAPANHGNAIFWFKSDPPSSPLTCTWWHF